MMPKITVEISERTAQSLAKLVHELGRENEYASHGPLDVARLAAMLLDDAALVVERPGSWEGAKMADLLTSHGYRL